MICPHMHKTGSASVARTCLFYWRRSWGRFGFFDGERDRSQGLTSFILYVALPFAWRRIAPETVPTVAAVAPALYGIRKAALLSPATFRFVEILPVVHDRRREAGGREHRAEAIDIFLCRRMKYA